MKDKKLPKRIVTALKLNQMKPLTCVMVGEPLHNVDRRLMIVDTEAAVALVSGATAVAVFVVVDFPGVFCDPPAVVGPAALESLVNSSSTNPEKLIS